MDGGAATAKEAAAEMYDLAYKALAAAQEADEAATALEEAATALEEARKSLAIAKGKAQEALAAGSLAAARTNVAAKAKKKKASEEEQVEAIEKASPSAAAKDFVTPPTPASSVGSSVSGFQIDSYDMDPNVALVNGVPQDIEARNLIWDREYPERKRKAVDADGSSADGPVNSAVDLYLKIISANVRSTNHLKQVTDNAVAVKADELLSKQWPLIFGMKDLIVSPDPSSSEPANTLSMVQQLRDSCDNIHVLARHLPPAVSLLVKQQSALIHELKFLLLFD